MLTGKSHKQFEFIFRPRPFLNKNPMSIVVAKVDFDVLFI